MILTCPSCATSYFTPDEAIGPSGRRVRCKSCAHIWQASPEEPLDLDAGPTPEPVAPPVAKREVPVESLAETPAPELPKAFRARAEQQRRLRRAATHGVVWAGVASAFAALLTAGWLFRVEVVDLYPRAAAAYAAVGTPVNPTGLEFEAISARTGPDSPDQVLVSGALRNVRAREVIAPPVRLSLLDAHGAEIGHAVVRIDAAPVLPGKVQGFAVQIPDPGGKAAGVDVIFLSMDEARPVPVVRPVNVPHTARPLPSADEGGLRPALGPMPEAVDLHPVDAVAVSDPHAPATEPRQHG
ncbi:MJ0042-type zinc finger domain-containing protein [uncultured Brevundimonas sp.]|uniref:MJ0042-type zinc finger domain-containing protein n=1 Tax=uncultured Brevundimonas sp. TaxID=213418 RepID=UPI0030EE481D|tara:strand:+ start:13882 stop:14775 length:894 start_codon:yes stop_codon:yes gene_type:complete